ncbi:NAD(P)H-binding protein [Sphingomonas sp. G124]|uniref:NAD(P)H-binding protein n=1 Tax=Sphingomonas cremea TaxID=2904799 RepID=A0A9X1TYR1_9SPHN|nr:NAD-dependent epimerase/dehydratase family protein [Sphingomonas cremea]MCF2515393.1 NAD(P)H-binding protein [Sphingomonas cremea]
MKLAITGATGFVGGRLLELALSDGHEVRALTRRPQAEREGVTWVHGALDHHHSLDHLTQGVDAVIHVAGVLNARDAAGFEAGNVEGTRAMLGAARNAGAKRFVHVSSLAAREPKLSMYGASKARSEQLVHDSSIDSVIVRPPAVYGPGDKETLELFKMAKRGFVLLPPKGRLSVIHVDDLGRLLLALAQPAAPAGDVFEPDDGQPGGWSHQEFASVLGNAFGRSAITFSAPSVLIRMGATIDRWLRGDGAKLTPDRASYFCHPDWVVDAGRSVPPDTWSAAIDTRRGVADTARWYEDGGWL